MSYKKDAERAREAVRKAKEERSKQDFPDRRNGVHLEVKESFSWVAPDFRTAPYGKKSIKIKGVAARSGDVSKNKRRYVEEELMKSARTLQGRPITVNHDGNRIVGHVTDAEFEDGALEFIGVVKKQPYVDYLRNKDKAIKGVSIEADYLSLKCMKCGERFYSEEEFAEHMETKHLVKEPIKSPHGIHFKALSLVVGSETPGIEDTSVEIMETARNGFLRLAETIVTEKRMAKPTFTSVGDLTLDQKRKKWGFPRLDEGCRWKAQGFDSGEACVAAMTGKVDDPDAFCYGPAEETKEQDEGVHGDLPPTHPHPEGAAYCGPGTHYDEQAGVCLPDVIPAKEQDEDLHGKEPPAHPHPEGIVVCGPGTHYDEEGGVCVPDEIPAEPAKVQETAINFSQFPEATWADKNKKAVAEWILSTFNDVLRIRERGVNKAFEIEHHYLKSLDMANRRLHNKIRDLETRRLKETWNRDSINNGLIIKRHADRIQKLETRIDNFESKLRGNFKGRTKALRETEETSEGSPTDLHEIARKTKNESK